MFSFFKSDPVKKLKKKHLVLLEKAMHAQRNGNIKGYALLTAEAEALEQKIQALEQDN